MKLLISGTALYNHYLNKGFLINEKINKSDILFEEKTIPKESIYKFNLIYSSDYNTQQINQLKKIKQDILSNNCLPIILDTHNCIIEGELKLSAYHELKEITHITIYKQKEPEKP